MSPNKTLAAQLYAEFKELFPNNAVEYFVSYYDYYQPEAYIPSTDTYIEKDSSINDEIDKLRHSATTRCSPEDVLVVASVSCIYGLGAPRRTTGRCTLYLETGDASTRDDLLRRLVDMQYTRNDHDFHRGTFRVRGRRRRDLPAVRGAGRARRVLRRRDRTPSAEIDPLCGCKVVARRKKAMIYPGKSHYVAGPEDLAGERRGGIRGGAAAAARVLQGAEQAAGGPAPASSARLYDLEMLEEMGFCSRGRELLALARRAQRPQTPPYTLYDYFPEDFCWSCIDESHVTCPRSAACTEGDRSRKETLVEYGFRLPSALDNRPLRFDEWEEFASDRPAASTCRRPPPTTSSRMPGRSWSSRSSARPG